MISNSVLWVIVGADFFGALSSANDTPGIAKLFLTFFFLDFPELGAEESEGDFAILGLFALLSGDDDGAGGKVGEPDGGVDFIDVLAARTRGSHELPVQVFFFDVDG